MKQKRVSVVAIVALALVTVTTLFLGVLGYLSYHTQERNEYEQLQQQMDYSAEQLAAAVALPLWNFDEEQIDSILDSAMKFQSVYGITLAPANSKDRPRTIRMRDQNDQIVSVSTPFATAGLLKAGHPVVVAQKEVGFITIYASPRYIQKQLIDVFIQAVVSIAIIDFLLVVSLYYVLWRLVLRPLQHVKAYAVLVGSNEALPNISAHHFRGELESLRVAVMGMAELLASRLRNMREQSSEIAAKEQQARLSEMRVQQILTASPLPITVGHLKTGVYIRVNPAWERHFGYQEADILGKTSVDLGFWKDMADRQGWIDRFNADGRVSGYEATFRMRDGTSKIFMLSSERFLYGDEECVLTMSVDVTERKALETELLQLNAHLEHRVAERTQDLDHSNKELVRTMETLQHTQTELMQADKLASLGSLVAGVAHELNTPIGNALVAASSMAEDVTGITRALADGTMKRSAFDSFLSRVAEGSDLTLRSLQRAVSLISSFKQVAVDQASERRREFDLAQMLNEVIDTLKPNLKRASVKLSLELQDGIAMRSYPGPLGQVIINLFTNAMAHAFDERGTGTISIRALRLDDSHVRVLVSDDGAGIAPEHLGQIFDPFFTTKLGRGGSGLGLSVSHRIVIKVLGGQINIRSKLGEGASFELTLPMVAPEVVA